MERGPVPGGAAGGVEGGRDPSEDFAQIDLTEPGDFLCAVDIHGDGQRSRIDDPGPGTHHHDDPLDVDHGVGRELGRAGKRPQEGHREEREEAVRQVARRLREEW